MRSYVQALRHSSTEKEVWSVLTFFILSISSDLEYLCLVAHVFRGDTVQGMMNSSLLE